MTGGRWYIFCSFFLYCSQAVAGPTIEHIARTLLAVIWHAAFVAPFVILMFRASREETDRGAFTAVIAGWINFAIGWAFFRSIPLLARYWLGH